MQNFAHAFSSFETSPDTHKSQPFAYFDENEMLFISLKINPRLNALFTALCVQNVVHASSSVETSPESRKSQPFAHFNEN